MAGIAVLMFIAFGSLPVVVGGWAAMWMLFDGDRRPRGPTGIPDLTSGELIQGVDQKLTPLRADRPGI